MSASSVADGVAVTPSVQSCLNQAETALRSARAHLNRAWELHGAESDSDDGALQIQEAIVDVDSAILYVVEWAPPSAR